MKAIDEVVARVEALLASATRRVPVLDAHRKPIVEGDGELTVEVPAEGYSVDDVAALDRLLTAARAAQAELAT